VTTRTLDNVTGSFVTYFPKRMKPSTLQERVLDIYDRVYTHRGILRRVCSKNIFASVFGVAHGYGIKRMNRSVRRVVDGGYMEHLRRIEVGLYDSGENLIETRLAELDGLPLPPPLEGRNELGRYEHIIPILALPGAARYGLARLRWKVRQALGFASPA